MTIFHEPKDDPTWPVCVDHGEKHWCDNMRAWIVGGKDDKDIDFGERYCVPIVPMRGLYATIEIDAVPIIPDLAGTLSLIKEKPAGLVAASEESIRLGMWTKGEGRLIFTTVLLDWAAGQTDNGNAECPLSTHGFKDEIALAELRRDQSNLALVCWSLAYIGHCPPCQERLINNANVNNWTASTFGLNPSDAVRTNQNTTGRRRNNAAEMMNQLQGRFGMPGS